MAQALVSYPRETFTDNVPSTFMRKSYPPFLMDTVAMHWDGTYRDRRAGTDRRFWPENGGSWRIAALGIAKHLA